MDTPFHHFGFLCNRVGRLIAIQVQKELDKAGYNISTSHLSIIADLWIQNGLSQSDLGTSLVKGKSTINAMLKHLVNEALIEIKIHPNDRRVHQIFLTNKGRQLCSFLEVTQQKIDAYLTTLQSPKNIKTTKETLSDLFTQLQIELTSKS